MYPLIDGFDGAGHRLGANFNPITTADNKYMDVIIPPETTSIR